MIMCNEQNICDYEVELMIKKLHDQLNVTGLVSYKSYKPGIINVFFNIGFGVCLSNCLISAYATDVEKSRQILIQGLYNVIVDEININIGDIKSSSYQEWQCTKAYKVRMNLGVDTSEDYYIESVYDHVDKLKKLLDAYAVLTTI